MHQIQVSIFRFRAFGLLYTCLYHLLQEPRAPLRSAQEVQGRGRQRIS